ncbi:hypothetical protein IUY40_02855 [Flavobacterium sp. ALJ2]|uniref:DUF7833 domain-containing protein n=1 Tax=Flavobacterium sp. ALJ2 TaxID=2786960 RepID=UPI0018A0E866|nr:hypothetical protein [Flavobacterium sp. ALJ2]MBF7090485.1 hypothetical protein [Flavobacterium sp. ALJ2]
MAEEKLDYFKLMRDFWDYAFKNPEIIKPNHCAIYAFAVEHCNRLGWKEKFGFPTSMVLDAVGIKSYSVYKKSFDELVDFGFFEVIEYSKNQYSANIIALKENSKALDKALDKAFVKHSIKQAESTDQSILQRTGSIIKQDTNIPLKPLKQFTKNEIFGNEILQDQIWLEAISMKNKIPVENISDWILKFNEKLVVECDDKINKQDYAGHFSRWLTGEVLKSKKSNGSGGLIHTN